jgi:hypothetical protein
MVARATPRISAARALLPPTTTCNRSDSGVALTGLSQTNAARLQGDGAFAFLAKAELALDQGVEPLLAALREIVKKLPTAPPRPPARADAGCKESG